MVKNYFLPAKLRKELKRVWGVSIFGTKREVGRKYQKIIKEKKFKRTITVGDYCSLNLPSDVKIFDGKIERKKVKKTPPFSLQVSNPSGTIQKKAWRIVAKAIRDKKNILVEGEEDLLAIPAVLLSPPKCAVIYGFPKKGVCLVETSSKVKKEIKELLKKFKTN